MNKCRRHERNIVTKNLFEEENAKRVQSGMLPNKRKIQNVLSFATKTPSSKQIKNRIIGGVSPSLATGEKRNSNDIVHEAVVVSRQSSVCHGILKPKNITDFVIHRCLKYMVDYYQIETDADTVPRLLHGSTGIYSLFCLDCTGQVL